MQDEVVDELGGPYFPFNRREHYPRQLKVDFRKLTRKTLLTYTAHHELHVRPDSTHEELAIAAARHFAVWRVNEESIMRSFIARMTTSTLGARRGLGDDAAAAERKRKRIDKPVEDVVPLLPRSPEERPIPRKALIVSSPPRQRQQRSRKRRRRGQNRSGLSSNHASRSRGNHHVYDFDEEDAEEEDEEEGDEEEENWVDGEEGRRMSPPPLPRHRMRYGEKAPRSNRLPRCSTKGSGFAPTALATGGGRSRDGKEFVMGEQVAAYVTRSDIDPDVLPETWILARVVRVKSRGRVELHDEDDASHVFELPLLDVLHLRDISSKVHKHDKVMAVFPDTTMFYCATVAKDTPRMKGDSKMLVVQFEDDEDDSGKPRLRRVPVEHVILIDGHAQRDSRSYKNWNENGIRRGNGNGNVNRNGGIGNGGGNGRKNGEGNGNGNRNGGIGNGIGNGGGNGRKNSQRHEKGDCDGRGGGAAGFDQQGKASTASRGSGGGCTSGGRARLSSKEQSKKVGTTYADMIAHALSCLEGGSGTFTDICDIIEVDFCDVLNWKLESDTRKTPVWRSSVRKILFSNSRFSHSSNTPNQGYVFSMALNGKI